MSTLSAGTPAPALSSVGVNILTHILHYLVDPRSAAYTLAHLARVSRLFRQAQQQPTLWQNSKLRADTPQHMAALSLLHRDSLPHLRRVELLGYSQDELLPPPSIAALQLAAPNVTALRMYSCDIDEEVAGVLSDWRLQEVCIDQSSDRVLELFPQVMLSWCDTLTSLEWDIEFPRRTNLIDELAAAAPTLTSLKLRQYKTTPAAVSGLCRLTNLRSLFIGANSLMSIAGGHLPYDLLPLATSCPHLQSLEFGGPVLNLDWLTALGELTDVGYIPSLEDQAEFHHLQPPTSVSEIRFLGGAFSPGLTEFQVVQLSQLPSITALHGLRLAYTAPLGTTFAAMRHLQCLSVFKWSAEQIEQLCRRPPPNLRVLEFVTMPVVQQPQKWHAALLRHLAASKLTNTLQQLSVKEVDLTGEAMQALHKLQRLHSLTFCPLINSAARKQFAPNWWKPVLDGLTTLQNLRRLELLSWTSSPIVRMSDHQLQSWLGHPNTQRLEYLRTTLHVTDQAADALAIALSRMPQLTRLNLRLLLATGPQQFVSPDVRIEQERQLELRVIEQMRQLRRRNGLGLVQIDT